MHAVTRTHPRLHESANPTLFYSELGTRGVANAVNAAGLLPAPYVTHGWLLIALDIDRYPLRRRKLDEPLLRLLR